MKNVAPNGRSFDSDMPFTTAAIACSRMPKCRLRPPGVPGSKSPAPSNLSVVLFDGPRSAEPPRNHGMFCASTFSTWPDASRPATPFASAGNVGQVAGPSPSGSSRRCICVDLGGERRILARGTSPKSVVPLARAPARRARRCPARSARARRRARGTARPRASRTRAWSACTSSSPSGSPCAAAVSCRCGEP